MFKTIRNTTTLLLALATVLAVGGDVRAEDRFGVGLKAGTYGWGADFGVALTDLWTVRGSFHRLDVSESESIDDIDYDADLELGGEGILVDLFPMRGQFRLTAGVFSNRNDLALLAVPTTDVEIGNNTYTPAEIGTLTTGVGFDDTAPYLGLGWGNVARGSSRVRFVFDVGVLLQGSPEVAPITASAGMVDPADLDLERFDIEDDLEDFDLWPVLNLGIAIRF